MATNRFVVTVDDPGALIRDLEVFARTRRFFDAEGAPATFFVVPRGEGDWRLHEQADWLDALHAAERDGHDCQLHGLDHHGCEFGPFPAMVRALGGDPEERLRADTERYGHLWRPEIHLDKLRTACDLYTRAFERAPLALRTGALSQTPELYEVMPEAGLRYASNRVTDPRGWAYIIERYDDPGEWDPAVPPGPYHLTEQVVNLPMISEYAWYLTEAKLEPHLALAIEDLERVFAAGGVFLLICHVQCVGAEDGLSQRLLHRLLEVARRDHQVEFLTVRGLIAEIEAGVVPVRPRPATD